MAERNIRNISENVSEIKEVPEDKSISYVERDQKDSTIIKQQQSVLMASRENHTETVKQGGKEKATLKGFAGKKKIVRNKMEEQESSLEVIPLKKNQSSVSKSPLKVMKEEEEPALRTSIFERKKEEIEKLILDFHQNTVKFILPISKKLLHAIKKPYLAYCSSHGLTPSSLIQ